MSQTKHVDQLNRKLWSSVLNNKIQDALHYLNNGANVYYTKDGQSNPLIIASEKGYLDMVKMLVERGGAHVHCREGRAFTQACKFNHADVVDYLLNAGNMTTYAGEQLRKMAQATGKVPDRRLVDLIVAKRDQYIEKRMLRMKEINFFASQPEEKGKRFTHRHYDELKKKFEPELRIFMSSDCSRGLQLVPDRTVRRMLSIITDCCKQFLSDKKDLARSLAEYMKEMLTMYDIDAECYRTAYRQSEKTHSDLRKAFEIHLIYIQPKITEGLEMIYALFPTAQQTRDQKALN